MTKAEIKHKWIDHYIDRDCTFWVNDQFGLPLFISKVRLSMDKTILYMVTPYGTELPITETSVYGHNPYNEGEDISIIEGENSNLMEVFYACNW